MGEIPAESGCEATAFGMARIATKDGRELCYAVADPSNIWTQNGKYYFIIGNLPLMDGVGT